MIPSDEAAMARLAAEFVTHNCDRVFDLFSQTKVKLTNEIKARLRSTYSDYLNSITTKFAKSKTFFIRDELTYLYDYYVPIGAKIRDRKIDVVDASSIGDIGETVVITGTAGSGKSTILRHLLLNEIVIKKRVPIFVELRHLNQLSAKKGALLSLLFQTLAAHDFSLDRAYIGIALNRGHFTILMDGLDEVEESKREFLAREINFLVDRFESNRFVVTSRPDPCFAGWPRFAVAEALPLDQARACSLVAKLPADDELKDKFLSELQKGLFEKHASFLSNPLLLTIMLLTYGQSADIPSRISLFYHQAYESLFQCHDALKGAFKRRRSTHLDIQEFATVFAAFSIQAYDARKVDFSRADALKWLDKAKQITGIAFQPSDFLQDALQAVCLIMEDGLRLCYAHRSFQEYFSARFIVEQKRSVQSKLIRKFARRINADSVIPILWELNPAIVEDELILPHLDELTELTKCKETVGVVHWLRYLKASYDSVGIDSKGIHSVGWGGPPRKNRTRGASEHFIDRFIVAKYRSTRRSAGGKPNRDRYERATSGLPQDCDEVRTSSLTTNSELAKYLFEVSGFVGGRYFESLIKARKNIRESRHNRDESVIDALGI